jgi:tRNA A37 threonylcarbamoyladenosine dehydratase
MKNSTVRLVIITSENLKLLTEREKNMNHIEFNQDKLSVDLDKAKKYRIYVFGYGAVGTYVVDQFVRFGFNKITIFDFDVFEPSNLSKSSGSITTSSIAQPKAFVGSNLYRNQLDQDSCITGVNGDILRIGSHCFDSESPSIFVACLDNVEAKLHVNRLFKQQNNAILINCGTNKNLAMAMIIDGKEACLECVLDQSSKQQVKQRNQCMPIYRQMILSNQAPTSAMASSNAARLAIELTRKWMLDPKAINKWVTDLNLQYIISSPLKDANCKACVTSYKENVISLSDCSVDSTLNLVLQKIKNIISHDQFELALPYAFIISDTCRLCGDKIEINSSISRLLENDIRCEKCIELAGDIYMTDVPVPEMVHSVGFNSANDVLARSLADLGIKLGDTLQVKVFTSPGTYDYNLQEFTCADDFNRLHSNRNEVI